ncbi:MAG TPA: SCO family protein [Candidatus Dormibacteraeota bacterium]|nr:SCO family protein [Candidatus Dormibacteraeota bacterium]
MRGRYALLGLLAAVIALGLVLPGLVDQTALPTPNGRLIGDAVWSAGSHPAPGFTLANQKRGVTRLWDLKGQVVLLTFMDSLCLTDCPIEAAELSLMQRQLGPGLAPLILIVSTDPAGDTASNIHKFVARYHLGQPYLWLTGSAGQLRRVWREYGIVVSSASTHSSAIYLIDRWGDEREGWGVPFPSTEFERSVRVLEAHYSTGWRWPWAL